MTEHLCEMKRNAIMHLPHELVHELLCLLLLGCNFHSRTASPNSCITDRQPLGVQCWKEFDRTHAGSRFLSILLQKFCLCLVMIWSWPQVSLVWLLYALNNLSPGASQHLCINSEVRKIWHSLPQDSPTGFPVRIHASWSALQGQTMILHG